MGSVRTPRPPFARLRARYRALSRTGPDHHGRPRGPGRTPVPGTTGKSWRITLAFRRRLSIEFPVEVAVPCAARAQGLATQEPESADNLRFFFRTANLASTLADGSLSRGWLTFAKTMAYEFGRVPGAAAGAKRTPAQGRAGCKPAPRPGVVAQERTPPQGVRRGSQEAVPDGRPFCLAVCNSAGSKAK